MAETIKEFLVSIGYKVDGASEQRFERSIGRATLRAELLGKAIAEAAEAVVKGATRIAASFDDIYYASQRTKASVENLKSLGYAVSQLGGSYQGTVQAIEAFARNIRSNPGYESLVRTLGVATRENGKLRDTVTITKELAKALAQRPYYIQKQYFEALGLDERTYQALQSGELTGYIEDYRRKQRELGVDQDQAAKVGQQLTRTWRELGLTLTTLGEKMMIDLAPSIEKVVKGLDDFIVRHKDTIVHIFESMARAGELVAKAFIKIAEVISPLLRGLDELAKTFTGEGALTLAMAGFATWLTGVWLVKILGAFSLLSSGWAAMLLRLGINPVTLLAGGALALSTSPAGGGEDAEIARRRADGSWGRTMTGEGGSGAPPQITDNRNWWQRTMPNWLGGQDAPSAGGGSRAPIEGSTFGQKSPGIMRRLMEDFGFTKEQAAGVLGNLGHESGGLQVMQERNPMGGGRGGYGWAQWTGPRRRRFEEWAAARGLDINSDEANYGFLRHELQTNHRGAVAAVKRTGSATEAMIAFENEYERAGIKAWGSRSKWTERALRAYQANPTANMSVRPEVIDKMTNMQTNSATLGGPGGSAGPPLMTPRPSSSTMNIDMPQKTEITVIGGGDPQATASAVADAQKGVNGTLLRNMQGAVR